jgi:glycosyltransferase involved in cell wall biosynthesis
VLWSAMKRADLLISISKVEGRPNVLLEAMAAGCPLAVSDIPAHREIVDDRSAIIVRNFDKPERVADAVVAALSDPASLRQQSELAKHRALLFTVENMGIAYEAVYRRAMARGSALNRRSKVEA